MGRLISTIQYRCRLLKACRAVAEDTRSGTERDVSNLKGQVAVFMNHPAKSHHLQFSNDQIEKLNLREKELSRVRHVPNTNDIAQTDGSRLPLESHVGSITRIRTFRLMPFQHPVIVISLDYDMDRFSTNFAFQA